MKNTEIAHRRLHNQGLTKIIFKTPADVVAHLGAVQAQDYGGAKWALGLRIKNCLDSEIDQAFNNGSILRTHLLRPTWHFVTPKDIRWMLMLTAPRVHAANAYYYRKTGLDAATVKRTNSVIAKALRNGNFFTRTEIASALEKAGVSIDDDLRLTYIMMHAELDGVICSGPRKGKQFTYALMDERIPRVREVRREETLAELTKRYFSTRGPASLSDFSWWSGLTMADAQNGINMVKAHFTNVEVNGRMYWFPESGQSAKVKSSSAYLLPNYDEYFIGFNDRSAIGEITKKAGITSDDPSMLANIVILNGQVLGGWKRVLKKDVVHIEINPIKKLSSSEKQSIENAAERFGGFLGCSVSITYNERS